MSEILTAKEERKAVMELVERSISFNEEDIMRDSHPWLKGKPLSGFVYIYFGDDFELQFEVTKKNGKVSAKAIGVELTAKIEG